MEHVPHESKEEAIENLLHTSDIAVNAETGLAMVIIKPDAFQHREEIVRRLENSGLYIVNKIDRVLPERFVTEGLYHDLPPSIEAETVKHFNEGPAEVLLIRGGPDMVEALVSLTGKKTAPSQCSEKSIRNLFGEHFARKAGENDSEYYRNAIHRPKNNEEKKDGLEKYRSISL